MTHKIKGPELVGFSDFFGPSAEPEVIGANKKPVKGKPPKTYKFPKPPRTVVVEHHGKVLNKARHVVAHAVDTVKKAAKLLAQHAPTRPGAKPLPRPVHVGAAAAAAMTPKQKLAVQKHNAAAVKAQQATKLLAAHTLKAKKSVEALAKRMVAQKHLAQKMRKKAGGAKTHVGELLADSIIGAAVQQAFQDYYTAVGADPDPNNPGFLTDGSPDPAASGDTGAASGGAGLDASLDTGALTDDPLDSGQLPAAPPMDQFIPDMTAVGGIAYHGEKGYPDGFCGSYNLFTRKTDVYEAIDSAGIDGTSHFGYIFGRFHDSEQKGGLPFGDDLKSGVWNHVWGRHWAAGANWSTAVDPKEAFASNSKTNPKGVPYGPLVGNPNMPDFAAMRVDGQGNMFWLPQEAPDWLTFPLKQAAALTAQQAAKAQKDAEAAAAAAAAKQQADAAAAQAAQDAQNALAESAAKSQAAVAETQQQTDAQQALIDQQKADTAEQQLETQQAQQAGDLLIQQAQQQAAWNAQHPDLAFGPGGGAPDGGGDDGTVPTDDGSTPHDDGTGDTFMPGMESESSGGEGEYDDGTPTPGGDILLDADGEGFQG